MGRFPSVSPALFVLSVMVFMGPIAAASFPDNQFSAVAVAASNDAWAVGLSSNSTLSIGEGLIEHWNGVSWTVVPNANPGATLYGFNGITVASSSDVWAVGYSQATAGAATETLVEHWNGSQWSIVPSPSRNAEISSLFGVTAVSATNVWAVGYSGDQNTVAYQTLVEHWNGTQWQIVASPNTGYSTTLSAVSAASASDIWAAGWYKQTSRGAQIQVTEHWNGTAWSLVSDVNRSGFEFRRGITAVASNNAWSTGPFLTEHWNGSSWSQVTVPGQYNILTNLAAISITDIWALGREYINTNNTYLTLAEHWDGSQWSVDSTPNPSATFNALYGGGCFGERCLGSGHVCGQLGQSSDACRTLEWIVLEHRRDPVG